MYSLSSFFSPTPFVPPMDLLPFIYAHIQYTVTLYTRSFIYYICLLRMYNIYTVYILDIYIFFIFIFFLIPFTLTLSLALTNSRCLFSFILHKETFLPFYLFFFYFFTHIFPLLFFILQFFFPVKYSEKYKKKSQSLEEIIFY